MKKKQLNLLLSVALSAALFAGCGTTSGASESGSGSSESQTTSESQAASESESKAPSESSSEAVKLEGFVDRVPAKYGKIDYITGGKIEHITYKTKDYFGDGAELTKPANVYLPKSYDPSKKYNVLYLMHGIGGNESEWGMYNSSSVVKCYMDNLIKNGDIEPFIVVAPNGRSCADFANTNADWGSFYPFGQELRNDLIPYIDSHYSTYGEYKEGGYDLTAARDHRAMAGLSMGGMQTTNIGMCECLDIISWFGAFSAAPTTYSADEIATHLKDFPDYDVKYYYAICGKNDGTALNSASAAVNGLTSKTDKLTDGKNFKWQTVPGAHDFNVWYLGYFNFARIAFQNPEE